MADNKEQSTNKPKVKYKFGKKEFDLDKYITNIDYNVKSYLDSKKNWSEGQKQEFMNSYNQYMQGLQEQLEGDTGRFSADSFGNITDTQGILGDTDNDLIDDQGSEYYYNDKGEQIKTSDYNNLKEKDRKKYKTFSANREVITYLDKIGRTLDQSIKEGEKEKEKFNIGKHGFLSDWQKRNSPFGEEIDITPYLNLDAYEEQADGTKKRSRTNRIKYLQDQIKNYLDNLNGEYDFEGSAYKDLDDYKTKLQILSDKLSDGWTEDDMIAANQAGIGASFYNSFFTEDENPGMTAEEAKAREGEAKKKVQQDAQNKWIDEQIALFDKNGYQWHYNNPHNLGKVDAKYWSPETGWNGEAFRNSFVEGSPEWAKYYNRDTKQFDYQTYFNDYLANPFSKEGKRAIAGLIGNGYAQQLQGGKYQGMYYIPQYERDRRTNSGLIYDPLSGRLFYTFIGDIPDQWNKMIEEYKLANGLIEKRDSYKFKEGGPIEMMQLGGGFDANAWMEEDRQKGLEAKGAKKGRTVKQQEAGDRVAGVMGIGVKDTAQNTENGFSATDYLRLGTIAADIVSMGSAFVPGVGTALSAATGISSSLGTFFADAFEDGLDSGDFKNLGLNLGMDVLGLIPGGGSASKGVKIAKNLAKYASRITATIGAMTTLANGQQIINSFKKLNTPSELTVDDWRNISAGLGLITGGVAAGTRKYQKAKMKAANAKPDNIAVEMVSKDGAKKTVLFNGEDAKAIRTAKDAKAVKNITSKYEDYKDWEVSTTGGLGWRGFKGSEGKWQSPIGQTTGKARVFNVSNGYDMLGNQTGKVFANRGKWEADVELTSANNPGKTVAQVDAEVDAFKNQLLDPMKKESKFVTARKTARENSVKKHEDLLQKQEDQAVKITPEGYNTPQGKPGTGEGLNSAELQEYKYLQGSESQRRVQVQKLRDWLNQVNAKDYHTQAYNNFRANHVDAEGNVNIPVPGTRRAIQGTFENLIKDLGIFKEGGSLNINRVRKFKEAGKITNTTSKANWFTDMYSSPEMTKWLNTFNVDNFEDFNNLQRSWATNKTNTGYSTGMSHIATPKNQGVWDRQALWNQTGTNAAIERAFNDGKITRAGVSGDNKESNYQDGFFGEQEFLRHGGTKESWAGKENELKSFQDALAKKGLSYTLGSDGMYYMGLLNQNTNSNNITNSQNTISNTNPSVGHIIQNGNTNGNSNKGNTTHSNLYKSDTHNLFSNILNDPTVKYGIPRALYANYINRKLTDMAIDSENPFLQDPFEVHRTVKSDLNAEMQGERSAAQMRNMINNTGITDIDKKLAANLETEVKAQDFINQGKKVSDDAEKQSKEQAWLQEKENAKNRHDVSMQNRLSDLQTLSNIKKHEMAYLAKNHENISNLWKQFEQNAMQKYLNNKQYEDMYAKQDISNLMIHDLENQAKNAGIGLTPEQIAAWNKVQSGDKTYTTLDSDEERKAYLTAHKVASQLETDLFRKYMGIKPNRWSSVRLFTGNNTNNNWTPQQPSYKNGAKIVIAGIQAKTKDAERFQKQIKESIDRNEKVLDRLSKSLYGYVKASIVK